LIRARLGHSAAQDALRHDIRKQFDPIRLGDMDDIRPGFALRQQFQQMIFPLKDFLRLINDFRLAGKQGYIEDPRLNKVLEKWLP